MRRSIKKRIAVLSLVAFLGLAVPGRAAAGDDGRIDLSGVGDSAGAAAAVIVGVSVVALVGLGVATWYFFFRDGEEEDAPGVVASVPTAEALAASEGAGAATVP